MFSGGLVSILWRITKNGQIALRCFYFIHADTVASKQLKTIDYYWGFFVTTIFFDVDFSNYTQPRQPINWVSKAYHIKYSTIHTYTRTCDDDDDDDM